MGLKDILKSVIIGGIFLIPFVPLIIANSLFFPFITGKAFAFRIIVEIIFAAWIILALLEREYLPKRSWILGAVIGFLLVVFLADVWGIDPYRSFWSNFERMEGFITLLHLGAFFLVVSSVLNSEKWWRRFFHLSLAVSIAICFYSFLQLAGVIDIRQGGVRIDGTIGNAIYLAVYMLFHIFIALYYFFQRADNYKYLYLGLIAMQTSVVYHTATRGVILGLIGGLLVTFFLIFVFSREKEALKKIGGLVILSVLILIGGFWLLKDSAVIKSNPVLGRFSELSFEGLKQQGRFFVWPMAFKGLKERPILGFGQENFTAVFNRHYDPRMYNQEPWFDRAHNTFLDWSIAAGILGLLAYLAIIVSILGAIWRGSQLSLAGKSVFSGLLAGYLFQSIFAFDNLTSYIMFFSVAAYVCFTSCLNSRPVFSAEKLPAGSVKSLILPVLVFLLLAAQYFVNYKPLLANRAISLAIQPQVSPAESLKNFELAFSLKTFGSFEATLHLLNQAAYFWRQPDLPAELKEDFLNLVKKQSAESVKSPKGDARLPFSIGAFYNDIGDYEAALFYLEQARGLSPRKQAILFEIAHAHFSSGRPTEALEVLKTAYELEPKNLPAAENYFLLLKNAGRAAEAEAVLEQMGQAAYFSDKLLNFFAEIGEYQKVLEIWQKRVADNPRNLTNRQSLVAAYLVLQRWSEAVAELRKIVELEPGFKETADFAIAEIEAGRGLNLLSQ